MKIGLLGSLRAKRKDPHTFNHIISHLEKAGHEVVHVLDLNFDEFAKKSIDERDAFMHDFFKRLEKTDVIFVECSYPSINVGYGIAYIVQKGKPVVILHKKGSEGFGFGVSDLVAHAENVTVYEYEDDTLIDNVSFALRMVPSMLDRRFNIIFPAGTMAKLEKVSRSKKIPKAVYIRQIIDEHLEKENV